MTKDEALKLALEALETELCIDWTNNDEFNASAEMMHEAIAAIKEALAQPAQEPVAWGVFEGNLHDMFFSRKEAEYMAYLKGSPAEVRPLYTAPQQRPWVGLTDEGIQDCYKAAYKVVQGRRLEVTFARAIEAKLKEKNT